MCHTLRFLIYDNLLQHYNSLSSKSLLILYLKEGGIESTDSGALENESRKKGIMKICYSHWLCNQETIYILRIYSEVVKTWR